MSCVRLYTGGCRSGKSQAAVEKAKSISQNVCFIATCIPGDQEMRMRVENHRKQRPMNWHVIEEALDIATVLRNIDVEVYPVTIIDCVTLWICNLMCDQKDLMALEDIVSQQSESIISAARQYRGHVIFVTNEVGMGIMPVNNMARHYADLVGRCNQILASYADEVIFFSCGIGLPLKWRAS